MPMKEEPEFKQPMQKCGPDVKSENPCSPSKGGAFRCWTVSARASHLDLTSGSRVTLTSAFGQKRPLVRHQATDCFRLIAGLRRARGSSYRRAGSTRRACSGPMKRLAVAHDATRRSCCGLAEPCESSGRYNEKKHSAN
jgi:hypothetical protein